MDELILAADKALVFPSGSGTAQAIVLDMSPLYKAESRLVELSCINKEKAGELTHIFMEAWSTARRYSARATLEHNRAKQQVRKIRAVILLDKAVGELGKRNLTSTKSPAGSEDLRDAVVQSDEEYLAAVDRLAHIEAVATLLADKAEVFKMAYYSVDHLVDRHTSGSLQLSGGTGNEEPGTLTRDEQVERFVQKHADSTPTSYTGGFGRPKY